MRRKSSSGLAKSLTYLLLFIIVIGGIFMATWDMPAPTSQIEETIPNARFKK